MTTKLSRSTLPWQVTRVSHTGYRMGTVNKTHLTWGSWILLKMIKFIQLTLGPWTFDDQIYPVGITSSCPVLLRNRQLAFFSKIACRGVIFSKSMTLSTCTANNSVESCQQKLPRDCSATLATSGYTSRLARRQHGQDGFSHLGNTHSAA